MSKIFATHRPDAPSVENTEFLRKEKLLTTKDTKVHKEI
jgi:hypothetical protein